MQYEMREKNIMDFRLTYFLPFMTLSWKLFRGNKYLSVRSLGFQDFPNAKKEGSFRIRRTRRWYGATRSFNSFLDVRACQFKGSSRCSRAICWSNRDEPGQSGSSCNLYVTWFWFYFQQSDECWACWNSEELGTCALKICNVMGYLMFFSRLPIHSLSIPFF